MLLLSLLFVEIFLRSQIEDATSNFFDAYMDAHAFLLYF